VLRWVLFLRADLEYEWPPLRFLNPVLLLPVSGCLLSLLTLGLWPRLARAQSEWQRWRASGQLEVWPFLRRTDYERVYRTFCPLAYHAPGTA
jgi:hypothetical protein